MNRNIIIAITVTAAIVLSVWFITFPLLINKEAVKAEFINSFAAATGMQLEIQGDVTVKILPLPHLSIDKMYVQNPAGSKDSFLIVIDNVDVWPKFTSLFSKVVIRKLQVSGVQIKIDEDASGTPSWQQVSKYWSNGAFQSGAVTVQQHDTINNIYFQVSDVQLQYTSKSGAVKEIDNMGVSWTADASAKKNSFVLSLNFMNRPITISTQIGGGIAQILSPAAPSLDINAISGSDSLQYSGHAGYKDGRPLLNGSLSVVTDDLAYWVKLYRGQSVDVEAVSYKKLPLTLKTKITMPDSRTMTFSDIALDGTTVKGSGQVDIHFPSLMNIKAAIKKLNLEDIMDNGFLNMHIETPDTAAQGAIAVSKDTAKNQMEIAANAKIDEIDYNSQRITDNNFSVDLDGDELTIPQFYASLPGNSRLDFSGIGRTGGAGLTVEGQVDVQGSNLLEAMSLFKSSGFALPPEDFKRFHIKANANISSQEMRLSELVAHIENISLIGGLVAQMGNRTSIHAALGINGINLDHIVALWGINNVEQAILSNNLAGNNNSVIFMWLKRLGYDLYLNSSLENYQLGGKLYNRADVNITATAATMDIEGKDVVYNDSHIGGKVRLDVSKDMPRVGMDVTIDNFDSARFFGKSALAQPSVAAASRPANKSMWSTDVFDFKWLSFINAVYNIKAGHFKYGNFNADNVELIGTIADRKLTVDSMKGNVLDADVSGKMIIDGSSIPTVNLAAGIYSLRFERLTALLPLFHNISGICNANIALSTNGINMQSWVSNLEGSIGLSGRDIEVQGFNMPGIIRAVSYVRTVADILDAVKRAFPDGNTAFSSFEGAWSISKGIAQTTRTRINNDQEDGTIAGKVDLLNWEMNINALFALKALDPKNIPSISVILTGSLDNPAIDLDTRALEQYVNNKTSENMLQKYGAH